MANERLTDLTEQSLPSLKEWTYLVDPDDTTDDAAGSSRKVTLQRLLGTMAPDRMSHRLTTETGGPISTADRTAQSTLYLTPYIGDRISLLDHSDVYSTALWRMFALPEIGLLLTGLTSGKNYDVFAFFNAATPASTDTGADTVTFATAPGWATGTWVRIVSTVGGLTKNTDYWVNASSTTVFSFHTTLANALAGTSKVDLTANVTAEIEGVSLELSAAWTTDTARADTLTTQNSVSVKSSNLTRRYLGTMRTTGTTTIEDSVAKRFLWNMYNRTIKSMKRTETTDAWIYDSGTFRQANGAAANQLDYVVGMADVIVEAVVRASWGANPGVAVVSNSVPYERIVGIGVDSTTVSSAQVATVSHGMSADGLNTLDTAFGAPTAEYRAYPGLGRHTLVWLERGGGGESETTLWFGDVAFNSGSGTGVHNGISGWLMG